MTPVAPYRERCCGACGRAMHASCHCARCGVEVHEECRRSTKAAMRRDFTCPRCGALMAREGGDQAFVLGVVLVVFAYLVFGGAFARDRSRGEGFGGYGETHARAHVFGHRSSR